MKIEDFKVGKWVYIPVVSKKYIQGVGNNVLGSFVFTKFKLLRLKVMCVQRIETPDDGTGSWWSGYKGTVVNFDTFFSQDEDIKIYKDTYGQDGYYPCMVDTLDIFPGFKSIASKMYSQHLLFPDNLLDDPECVLNCMLSTKKRDALKVINRLNKETLNNITYMANYFKFKKTLYNDVKKFLNS